LIYSYFIKHKGIALIYFSIYDVCRKLLKTLTGFQNLKSRNSNKLSKELIGK